MVSFVYREGGARDARRGRAEKGAIKEGKGATEIGRTGGEGEHVWRLGRATQDKRAGRE